MLSIVDRAIQLSQAPEEEIILQLGRATGFVEGIHYLYYSPTHFLQFGAASWEAAQSKLYRIFCDPRKRVPKPWLQEFFGGDVRELATAILTTLIAFLHLPVALAVPTTALFLKKGIAWFCQHDFPKPRKPVRKIPAKTRRGRKKA